MGWGGVGKRATPEELLKDLGHEMLREGWGVEIDGDLGHVLGCWQCEHRENTNIGMHTCMRAYTCTWVVDGV